MRKLNEMRREGAKCVKTVEKETRKGKMRPEETR